MAALPALSKVWYSRCNRPIASSASALLIAQSNVFALKEHLKDTATGGTTGGGTRNAGSAWVTKGSSDSVSFNTSGTDLITAHTNLVWANSGTAHSWWWGECAAAGYQVVVACANTSSSAVCVAMAPISTPFTGGSLTARPTSTQEFLWGTSSTGAATTVTMFTDLTLGGTNYTHFVAADDGQFWFLASRAGTGIFSLCIGFTKPTGSTDTRSAFIVGNTLASGRGAMGRSVIFDSSLSAVSRSPNGTVVVSSGGFSAVARAGGSDYLGAGSTDANSGKYLAFPTDAFCNLAGQYAWRGRVPDFAGVGTRPVGDCYPSTAAPERVVVGDVLLPCPGVAPIV